MTPGHGWTRRPCALRSPQDMSRRSRFRMFYLATGQKKLSAAVPQRPKAVGIERLDRSCEPLRHPKALGKKNARKRPHIADEQGSEVRPRKPNVTEN
jgi:hypothetical protein